MKKVNKAKAKQKVTTEIKTYDEHDSSEFVDAKHSLKFSDLGLKLPARQPTEVVSIRLPTSLLNQLRAVGSQRDIPYQALIKLFLSESLKKFVPQ